MTARSVSWTDAASVARLLERASAPQARTSRMSTRGSVARLSERTPAPEAAKPSVKPTALQSVAPPLQAPPIEHTSEHPALRLDALLAWTLDHHTCDGAFVADDNGLTLAAHGISEAHVSLVGPLLSSLVSVRSIPGIDATAGALWLGTNMMSWVEIQTKRGGFCLGVVGAEALPRQALSALQAALQTTLENI